MSRFFAAFCLVFALVACAELNPFQGAVAEFWRPISEPNVLLPPQKAQAKLAFDLSQCGCGIYPANVAQPDLVAFQPELQRYAETGVTITGKTRGDCSQKPSYVVAECMRARGWEMTTCSGRVPHPSGGALCTTASVR